MEDTESVLAILLEDFAEDNMTRQILDNMAFMNPSSDILLGVGLQLAEGHAEESTRIEGYVDNIVPHYSDVDFRAHFRMTRPTFQKLCEAVAPYLTRERVLTVEKKLLSTVWMLANKECYRSVADRFDMSKGTLHHTVLGVCHALASERMMGELIQFPMTKHEMKLVAEGFKQRCGFPGVVGAIDGTHIPIPAPKSEHRASYINRHGMSSMNLQVIVDHQLHFRDVCAGWPGSVHDARVYRNSPVAELVDHLPDDYHLLGDSAYPLSQHMIVPYRDNGCLDNVQKKFNKCHASTRVEVERAIGLLKGKFRRLKYLDMLLEYEIPSVIVSCCVLHNFILNNEGVEEMDNLDVEQVFEHDEEVEAQQCGGLQSAEQKRMDIALSL